MINHAISDDAFAHMVAQEVKNKASDEHRQFLMQPGNVDRWLKTLDSLLDNLNRQVESATQDMIADCERYERLGEDGVVMLAEARHYYEQKISKIEKFKFYVIRRISEVAALTSQYRSGNVDSEKMLLMCKDAISAHMRYLLEHDIETTPADEALYKALEGVWAFDQIAAPDEEEDTTQV